MRTIFFIALCATIRALAQAPAPAALAGSIDGAPLPSRLANVESEAVTSFMVNHLRQPTSAPADQQEITAAEQSLTCSYLKTAVAAASVARAKADLGVSATPQDIAAAKQQLDFIRPDFQKQWAQGQDRTRALIAGLIAVYDQSQDPLQVYQQMIAPHKIDQKDWLLQVYTHRTKAQRDQLAKLLTWTPDNYAKGYDDPSRIKYFAEGQKLEPAIDQRLAAADPTFSTYWTEYHAKTTHDDPVHTSHGAMRLERVQYIEKARAGWWKAENRKVQITLSDPALTSRCTGLTDPPPPISLSATPH